MIYQKQLERAQSQKQQIKKYLEKLQKNPPKELDDKFHTFHDETFKSIDCLQCANCCKTTSPIFLMPDIKRLAKALKISVKDFMTTYLTMDEEDDFVLTQAPCPFLQGDNSCSVYKHRPNACREYPHTNRKNMSDILDLTFYNTLVCPAVSDIVQRLQSIPHE